MLKINNKRFNYYFLYCFLLAIGLYLAGCSSYYFSDNFEGGLIKLDSTVTIDSATYYIIKPYKEIIDIAIDMNEIIAYSEILLTKGQPVGLLNNFVADLLLLRGNKVYLETASADISLLNHGGLRSSLPKGVITLKDIYMLMPFENEVVVVTINSENFKYLVKYIINNPGTPFAGMQLIIREGKLKTLKVQEEDFDESRNYRILTSDYLAYGGGRMNFFQNPVKIEHLPVKLRDLIIDYLRDETKKGNKIYVELDDRIVYE